VKVKCKSFHTCTSDRKGATSNSRKSDGRNKQTVKVFVETGCQRCMNCRRYSGASAGSARRVCMATLKTILSDGKEENLKRVIVNIGAVFMQ